MQVSVKRLNDKIRNKSKCRIKETAITNNTKKFIGFVQCLESICLRVDVGGALEP